MKISSATSNQSFKAANVNITAFSDTHGELQLVNCALEELRKSQKDIFCPQKKGNENVLAICGDWFMDGGKKFYKSGKLKQLGDFQCDMFNAFISGIKSIAKNTSVLFTPGNHEFDGGVALLDEVLSKMHSKIITTNMDIKNSSALTKTNKTKKLTNEFILNVEDDKNPKLKHKILFLGISPVNLIYYQNKLNGIKMIDNINEAQSKIKKEDYKNTLEECKKRISLFKEKNPRGITVLMNHTGVSFADNLAKEAEVDIAFDGHEHKDEVRIVNGTKIIPLSMNFNKIVNTKLKIDDDGKLQNITLKEIYPDKSNQTGILADFHKNIFQEYTKPEYTIKSMDGKLKELDIERIRKGNNFLANFVTDSVLSEIKKEESDIDFFAINASAIRCPLKTGDTPCVSELDIMNVLKGIRDEDGKIFINKLKGSDIVYMVLDNVLFNKDNPEKNPIIHYSGLKINKTAIIKDFENGAKIEDLAKYTEDIKTGKPVELDKTYKIANVEKYFIKSKDEKIKSMKEQAYYIGYTVQELFMRHFKTSNGTLIAKYDERIK